MFEGVKVKSPKLRGDEESGEDESEINLKKPTPGNTTFIQQLISLVLVKFAI